MSSSAAVSTVLHVESISSTYILSGFLFYSYDLRFDLRFMESFALKSVV